jgi:hypothetical protein
MKKYSKQKSPLNAAKTTSRKKLPATAIATISFFSITILMTSNISPVVASVHSFPPANKTLTEIQYRLSKNIHPLVEKSSRFTSLLLYLYIAVLHFIVIFTENYRPFLSLLISLLWPLADLYSIIVITILFIALYFMDIPELPHQNLHTSLSQILGT